MQPYGFPVEMPAYQQLADSGVTFRRAFSTAPTCSPSRAGLLTGMAPHSAGMLGLAHRGFALFDPSQHLAAYLAEHGYHTVLAGHQHSTSGDPHTLGYRTVYDSGNGHASVVAPNAVEFLREAARKDDEPFFLDVGFDESHRPFHAVPDDAGDYIAVLPGIPDTPETRADVAGFHASLRALDRGVGMVMDALAASGQIDNTFVILTTDHGPAFPSYKSTLTDRGIGVGLILRAPGIAQPGIVNNVLVSQIDLYPTICEIAGIPSPDWLQGTSLTPILDGSANRVRDALFGEVTFHAAYEPQRAIRTDRWTYIRRFEPRDRPVLPNIDASPALDVLLTNGYADSPVPSTSLFDNLLDPLQRENLAGADEFAEIERDLANRLKAWMSDTNDPLLNGPVPLPPGALVNRASGHSPDDPLVDSNYV
jgi:arylsulfatase A-like enzyme